MMDVYTSVMAEDGLDVASLKHPIKEYALTGDYRKIIGSVKDFSWEFLRYNDVTAPLSRTDLDVVNQVPEPQSIPDGKYLGLVIHLTLPSSSYATMALRELMRLETGPGFQAALNE
jgi:tRNA pseudouridine13 synthase